VIAPLRSEPGLLSDSAIAHWISALGHDKGLRGTITKTTGARAVARGVQVDAHDVADDVLARLAVALWDSRAKWADRDEDGRRARAFDTAKKLALQAVDAVVSQSRKVAAAGVEARRTGAIEVVGASQATSAAADPVDVELVRAVQQVMGLVMAAPGVGSTGWDRLLARARRSPGTKTLLLTAVELAQAGRVPDVTELVRPVQCWQTWAISRLRAGQTLSTTAAVADGLFHAPTTALRTLAEWWVTHRHPAAGDPCINQLVAAGLMDHAPARVKAKRARAVLTGLRNHNGASTEVPYGCSIDGQCTPAVGAHGIDLTKVVIA